MRIELRDINGYSYQISSTSGDVIGGWLAEYLPAIENAARNTGLPWTISLYPKDKAEADMLATLNIHMQLDADGLHHVAGLFEQASHRAGIALRQDGGPAVSDLRAIDGPGT